jgi:hypothetical protein
VFTSVEKLKRRKTNLPSTSQLEERYLEELQSKCIDLYILYFNHLANHAIML